MTGQRHPPSGRGAETRKEKQREHRCPLETGLQGLHEPAERTGDETVWSLATGSLAGSGAQSPPAKTPGAPGRPSTTSAGTKEQHHEDSEKPLPAGPGALAAPHPAACPHKATSQHRAEGCRQPPARVPGRWEGPTTPSSPPASPMGLSMVVLTPAPPRAGTVAPPEDCRRQTALFPCARPTQGCALRHQDR